MGYSSPPLPRMGNARGTLKESCTRFPPLLRSVCEERGGCLSGQVARVGTRPHLIARCPPRRRGVRHQIFKGFSPGDVSIPGSPRKNFQGGTPRVGVYKFFITQGVPTTGCSILPTPAPKAARVGRTFRCWYPPLGANVGWGG